MYSAQLPSALPEPLQPSSVLNSHTSYLLTSSAHTDTSIPCRGLRDSPRLSPRRHTRTQDTQKDNRGMNGEDGSETKRPPPFLGSGTEITFLSGAKGGGYSLPPDPENPLPMSRPRTGRQAGRQTNLFPVLDSRERNPTCLNLHQTAPTESHLSSPDNVSDSTPSGIRADSAARARSRAFGRHVRTPAPAASRAEIESKSLVRHTHTHRKLVLKLPTRRFHCLETLLASSPLPTIKKTGRIPQAIVSWLPLPGGGSRWGRRRHGGGWGGARLETAVKCVHCDGDGDAMRCVTHRHASRPWTVVVSPARCRAAWLSLTAPADRPRGPAYGGRGGAWFLAPPWHGETLPSPSRSNVPGVGRLDRPARPVETAAKPQRHHARRFCLGWVYNGPRDWIVGDKAGED